MIYTSFCMHRQSHVAIGNVLPYSCFISPIFVQVLNYIYSNMAQQYTHEENHRTDTQVCMILVIVELISSVND